MEAALERFEIDVTGMTCLDAGLSTGGFTDCLLQKGAIKVYGVDVGFGQVTEKLIARLVRMFTGSIKLYPAVRPGTFLHVRAVPAASWS